MKEFIRAIVHSRHKLESSMEVDEGDDVKLQIINYNKL